MPAERSTRSAASTLFSTRRSPGSVPLLIPPSAARPGRLAESSPTQQHMANRLVTSRQRKLTLVGLALAPVPHLVDQPQYVPVLAAHPQNSRLDTRIARPDVRAHMGAAGWPLITPILPTSHRRREPGHRLGAIAATRTASQRPLNQ